MLLLTSNIMTGASNYAYNLQNIYGIKKIMKNDILNLLNSTNKKWHTRVIKNHNAMVDYLEKLFPQIPLKEQLFLLVNNLPKRPKCENKKCTNYKNFKNTEYTNTCSYSCANELKKQTGMIDVINKKIKQTNLKKYNVENPQQNKTIKEKTKNTNIKKYGNANGILSTSEVIKRATDSRNNETHKNKIKQILIDKYNIINVAQLPNHRYKCKQTLLKNYNVDNYYNSVEYKNKQYLKRYNTSIQRCNNEIDILNINNPSIEKILLYSNPNYTITFNCNICKTMDNAPFETFKYRIERFDTPCKTCSNLNIIGRSTSEIELVEYIQSIYDGTINTNDKKIINPKELDIVLPNLNIAIEYNGLYWHSTKFIQNQNYHLNKLISTNNNNYKLITIFEDEWIHKKDIVKTNLKNLLHVANNISARRCVVQPIDTKIAKDFINNYHIQGYTPSNTKLGLFYDNKLVSVMTFSKTNNNYKLTRACNNINIIGGYRKLFEYFINNYNPCHIYTYSDLRWDIDTRYENIGMKYETTIKPKYWYVKNNTRMQNTNKKLYKIWDCGYKKYIWNKKGG